MWLEVLASNEDIVKKYYAQESFIGSPGWVQIKCELRLLSRFSFSLNPDWELAGLLPRQKTAQKSNTSTEGYEINRKFKNISQAYDAFITTKCYHTRLFYLFRFDYHDDSTFVGNKEQTTR